MAHRIVHLAKQHVELETFTPEPIAPGQVRVKSLGSLMSTGTETICFNRLFEPGSHWDGWVKYPFRVGYATIGHIVEVGEGVDASRMGQRVAVRVPHASESLVPQAEAYAVPDGVDTQDASWFALAKIAYHGVPASGFCIGQKLAIVGAGPLGQMATRWAHAAGVTKIIVVDTMEARLQMALAGGATDVIAKPIGQAKDAIWQICGGDGPDVAMDVTGHPAVLAPTLAIPRRYGQVTILGDTGTPSEQRLTMDVVIRGVRIVGAHDGHNTPQWNNATIIPLFFKMLAAGKITTRGLITHHFRPADVAKAFALASERRSETMGIYFDWQQTNPD